MASPSDPERADPRARPSNKGGTLALILALSGLGALAAAMGVVSYEGQYRFVARHKPSDVARIEALGPDIGAVLFASLAFAAAVRGRPALRARLGNVACTAASLIMNAMSARTPGGTLAAVLPPLLYAAASDTCIAELRQQALDKRAIVRRRTWPSVLLTAVRWCLRLAFAPLTTLAAARTWVLTDPGEAEATTRSPRARSNSGRRAPTVETARRRPAAVSASRRSRARPAPIARGPSRTSEVIRRYDRLRSEKDPRYGDPACIPALVPLLSAGLDLDRTTVSRALHAHVRGLAPGGVHVRRGASPDGG